MANLAAQSISKMQIGIPQAGHLDFEDAYLLKKQNHAGNSANANEYESKIGFVKDNLMYELK